MVLFREDHARTSAGEHRTLSNRRQAGYAGPPLAPYLQRDLAAEDQQTVAAFGESVRSDRDYPKLHLAPPVGRLNDPNGLIYDGRHYHAFYQYSPLHPERIVYWRHAISDDLTHWEDAGTALVPNTRYDSHGCYSGSGIRVPRRF